MNWILLAILAGLASNTFNFLNRFFLKEESSDPTAFAWVFESFRGVIFLAFSIFDNRIIWSMQSIILLLLLGITEFISVYLFMKMHAHAHLSISTILSRTRIVWIPILAFLLFHENLKNSEYFGILVLFLGLSIVVAPHKFFLDKGALYANSSAFMIALNNVIEKMTIPFASASIINLAMGVPSFFLFPLFMKNAKKRIFATLKTNFTLKMFAIAANTISAYLFVWALKGGEVSKVNAIYQGMMVVSVLAGIIFLKERKDVWKKLIGTGVTLVGIYLLTVL